MAGNSMKRSIWPPAATTRRSSSATSTTSPSPQKLVSKTSYSSFSGPAGSESVSDILRHRELVQTNAWSRTLLAVLVHSIFFSRMMLTYGKDIAIRIFEPCYLVTIGCCPNSKFAVLHKGIFFRGNTAIPKPNDDRFNVVDFPSEDRALQWREIRDF